MSPLNKVLLIVGLAVAAGGVVMGLVPLSSEGSSCGSVFAGTSAMHDLLVGSTGCSQVRSFVTPLVWALIGIGGVLAIGGALTDPKLNKKPEHGPVNLGPKEEEK